MKKHKMKKGGKAMHDMDGDDGCYKKGGAVKKHVKMHGHAAKKHMGKKSRGGEALDTTDAGVSPKSPLTKSGKTEHMNKGGAAKK